MPDGVAIGGPAGGTETPSARTGQARGGRGLEAHRDAVVLALACLVGGWPAVTRITLISTTCPAQGNGRPTRSGEG